MPQCISRRACPNRDTFRLVNEEGKIGHHIWTEYICTKETNELSQVCRECSIKNPGHREQSSQKFDHGLIGGPYTKESKLYGSPENMEQRSLYCAYVNGKKVWLPQEVIESAHLNTIANYKQNAR